jgi:murein DD-endopeptidase MepM/ murein hydrolase activator NlpD
LDKNKYTVLIVPQDAQVKSIILPPFLLKILIVSVGLAFVGYVLIFQNSTAHRIKNIELQKLRAVTQSQKTEIRYLAEKIAFMEEQAKNLKEMERQVKRDLKAVKELKRTTKFTPAVSVAKTHSVHNRDSSLLEDRVSILEEERTRIVTYLHQSLLELSKKAFQRENNLKEAQEFLQAQRSVLLATPSLWPVFGRITSRFGETRQSVSSGGEKPHRGLDIAAPVGTAILVPSDGVVSFAGWEASYGRLICIDHGHGFSTLYGHLQGTFVKTGEKVRKGQTIGTIGLSGNTNGPHLHYGVCVHGHPVNPAAYLTQSP